MVNITSLSNGLKIVMEEIPYVRSISFGIWVRNGSRNETPEKNGVSHFIEHMLFKGTFKRSAKQIAEEMDSVGGQINAYTTKEYTCYHTRVLDKHFDRAIDVISDMFLNSKFDENDIDKESNVILEEIAMYEDSPEELVHDILQENMWKQCTLGMPILGTTDSVKSLKREKILNYFHSNYQPKNTIISVAGNFKQSEMLEKLEKYFGNWKAICEFENNNSKTIYTPVTIKREKDIEQVHMVMAFPSIERDHKYKYPLSVFNTIFGGGMSSALFQKVREENGLTYSIYSYTSTYEDAGVFAIYAGLNPNQTEKTLDIIFKEIKRFKTETISSDLLQKTKEQIISNFIISTESTSSRMSSMGASVMFRGFVQSQEEIIKEIESITNDDMINIINYIFDVEKMSFSIVGNISKLDIEKLLENKF